MSLRSRLAVWSILLVALFGTPPVWIMTLPSQRARRSAVSPSPDPDRYRAHVEHLAGTIGSRSPLDGDRLDRAARYIESVWQEQGFTVRSQSYPIGPVTVRNLEVTLHGEDRSAPAIVIGAHYDTVPGSPGADDNASGVALLLELARDLRPQTPPRELRLVAFVAEEPPYFQGDEMGSLRYARSVGGAQEIAWMLSLESLGYFDRTPGSQLYPAGLASLYPSRGDFVGVVGNLRSRPLVEAFAATLTRHAALAVESGSLPSFVPGVGWSDHWSFWQQGIPAIMLTDTALFRNPHYHRATDTPKTLDFATLARLGEALPGVILELAGAESLPISRGLWGFLAWVGAIFSVGGWALKRAFRRERKTIRRPEPPVDI